MTAPDARQHLEALVGKAIPTLGRRHRNRIIEVRGDEVIVGTERSPGGEPVPIVWVQDAMSQLYAKGEILVTKENVGYRSAFIGAVLATLPGVETESRPRRVRLAASPATPESMVLPDVIGPNLKVVFCGTAAGATSARRGAYYAGPGNQFWGTLHEVGLTPRLLSPPEFRNLPEYGVGLTDLHKTGSGSDGDLATAGFDVERLTALIDRNAPGVVAFNGKKAAEIAFDRPVDYGAQDERIGRSRTFVLPSTSGAARGYWNISHWHELAASLG